MQPVATAQGCAPVCAAGRVGPRERVARSVARASSSRDARVSRSAPSPARASRPGSDDWTPAPDVASRLTRAALAASVSAALAHAAPAFAAAPPPAYSGVDPDKSELVQSASRRESCGPRPPLPFAPRARPAARLTPPPPSYPVAHPELLSKSRENKAAYDEQRLDNFYNRGYNINKLAGTEILPEPCDPRDPEFGYKCGSRLPRLPQDRTDPFDPRSQKYAPRRGAVLGLNDLNIEEEDDFPGSSSSSSASASSRGEERDATSAAANPWEGSVAEEGDAEVYAEGGGDGDALASSPGVDAIDREALDLDPDVHLGEGIMFE